MFKHLLLHVVSKRRGETLSHKLECTSFQSEHILILPLNPGFQEGGEYCFFESSLKLIYRC